jgi:HEAT repeat protein
VRTAPLAAVLAFVLAFAGAASADDVAGAGVAANAPPRDASAPGTAGSSSPTSEQMAVFCRGILAGLADRKLTTRVAAAERIVAAWPDSAPALDAALASPSADVRLAAVYLLGREELGDTKERIRRCLSDASPFVRVQAVRIARHLDWPKVEPDLIRLAGEDPEWVVRQEALRGLEDRGTKACLASVLAGWRNEKDPDRRRRFHRVLVRIVGADHGDDVEAWVSAVTAAERAER